jgi:hypothetical protein
MNVLPSNDRRAQGMPGRSTRPQPRMRKQKSTRVSHHGHTGSPGIPRTMVLTVSFALSSVTGLSCHRRPRISACRARQGISSPFRKLDASVGASGPHDFAVHLKRARLARHQRPSHPAPNVRDDRETPLQRDGTASDIDVIWIAHEGINFLIWDWTTQISLMALAFLPFCRTPTAASFGKLPAPF